ncbi:MAG TPA: DUF2089 domain-containing protein [Chloroflexota bacterium]|jgi:hypothetical protein|nr:DUF2089 domain-containing protein [Chloroflexota bacterium]
MRKILEQCPSCGGALAITGLQCTQCGVGVSGRFRPCDFCRLNDEQSTFLRLFVERRGNLSEMEKALGISYPTVRNKLEEIIRLLQQPAPQPAASPATGARDAILRQVATGQISAEDALARLKAVTTEG